MLDQPIIAFASAAKYRQWLTRHHAEHPGIWMKIAKKGSGIATVTYTEALDEALCLGWIDGQSKAFDEAAFLQKFTRRGKRSLWSKINVGHVARLQKEGRMKPAGLAAVDAAKADGRWDAAYHSGRTAEMPEDFLAALAQEPNAEAFFATLNKTQRYGFLFRITTAKKNRNAPQAHRRLCGHAETRRNGRRPHIGSEHDSGSSLIAALSAGEEFALVPSCLSGTAGTGLKLLTSILRCRHGPLLRSVAKTRKQNQ